MIFYDILWYSSNKRNKRVIISRRRINILAENPKSPKKIWIKRKYPKRWFIHQKTHTSSRNGYPFLTFCSGILAISWFFRNRRPLEFGSQEASLAGVGGGFWVSHDIQYKEDGYIFTLPNFFAESCMLTYCAHICISSVFVETEMWDCCT